MEEQVEFMGVLNHYDLLAFYDKVDIYIQPSYSEGLSRAIVEAMSMGCPVLCSRVGGNIELCNSESMFRAGDINQIASKIRSLMNKEKLVQESRRNFEFSKEFREDKLNNIRNKFRGNFLGIVTFLFKAFYNNSYIGRSFLNVSASVRIAAFNHISHCDNKTILHLKS